MKRILASRAKLFDNNKTALIGLLKWVRVIADINSQRVYQVSL